MDAALLAMFRGKTCLEDNACAIRVRVWVWGFARLGFTVQVEVVASCFSQGVAVPVVGLLDSNLFRLWAWASEYRYVRLQGFSDHAKSTPPQEFP